MRGRDLAAIASEGGGPAADALVQLCTFRIGSEAYAIDIMRVREIIHPLAITPVPRAPGFVEGVIRVRGEVIPVLDVRKRLGVEVRPQTRKTRFLIVNVAGRCIGLIVDEVCEVLRLPRSDIRPAPGLGAPGAPRFFLGVCGGDAGAARGTRDPAAAAKPPRSSGPPGGRLRLLLNVKALLDVSVAGEADAARAQAEASRRA